MMARGRWPGIVAGGLLLVLAAAALLSLLWQAPQQAGLEVLHDPYVWHLLRFTFWQAALSALLSVLPALFLARALARRQFVGRRLLLRLCSMTLVLPVLVAVFGLISVYGQEGWLAQLCRALGLEYRFSPYGLQGILLAHVFFNLPLATRLLLQSLESIPQEQYQIAAQLGMNQRQCWRWVEWPQVRRQLLPAASLIFMLCFASFAVVLALGGGPKASTLEVAIYQALTYDFDLGMAAWLALLQMGVCLALVLASQKLAGSLAAPAGRGHGVRWLPDNLASRLTDGVLIAAAILLLVPPLLAVVVGGISRAFWSVVSQPALWQATLTSLSIALCAGALALGLGLMIAWSSSRMRLDGWLRSARYLELSGMLILAMPGLVLATGLFLLLQPYPVLRAHPFAIVVLCNAMMALPYVLKTLSVPVLDCAAQYDRLCASLGMHGWRRCYWVEWRAL
ncbi:MAG: thiamine/thiamine pyrophosphate ABC transporter permease, partial [Plesiomonas shigelloides]